jgi:competence protein ComEC
MLCAGSAACLGQERAGCLLAFVLSGWSAAGVALGSHAERHARRPSVVEQVRRLAPDGQIELTGRLRGDASIRPAGVALALDVESLRAADVVAPSSGGVRLTVLGRLAEDHVREWRAGRRLRVTARLREPSRYYNDGVPDHRLALARSGTALIGSVKSAALVDVMGRGALLHETAAAVRLRVRDDVAGSVGALSPRSAAIVTAVLVGDRAGLDDGVERRLQEAGTYHVIAISGGNIAVFAVCLLTLARAARLPWRACLALTAAGLVLYGEIASGGSSVTRAIVVALVYLAATALDQRGGAASALAIAALLILCATPLALLDAGFILTFGATTAILTGARRFVAERRPGPAALLAGVTAASIATEAALLPVGALFFSRVTFAGPLLNIAAVPLMSVVQVGGMVTVAANRIHVGLGAVAAWVPHLAAEGLVGSAVLVDYAPWLTWRVAPPPWWLLAAYYGCLAAWLARGALLRRSHARVRPACRLIGMCVLGTAALVCSTPLHTGVDSAPGILRVSVLDVGQGDATVLRTPDGRAVLIDAGGLGGQARFDIGERVVAPAVWSLGVRRLDLLVVTHADPDHIGGAPSVLAMLRPREIWEGVPVPGHASLAALSRDAAARGVTWRAVRAGDEWTLGGMTMRVLNPPPPDWERQRVRNDDSIVLDIRYGGVSVILAGDIGADVERSLTRSLRPAAVRILKVAHHGSATSTSPSFLETLRPQIAIVSCGRDNRYGHPAPGVLERLASAGARIYRTDLDGAVTLSTDGRTPHVTTVQPR